MTLKVLIVDDLPDAIMLLSDSLQHAGHEVLTATSGQQALELAEEALPDIVLLDVMMAGMDGIETCRRLRMNPVTADLPVILVSARSPTETRAEGMLAGATDYITKPINADDLLERIERLATPYADLSSGHVRLLEEMVYTTLVVLPCDLAWLLAADIDNQWLVHRAIAMEEGAEAAGEFLSFMGMDRTDVHIPLIPGNNPLADVVLDRQVLIDMPTDAFYELPEGQVFSDVFERFGFAYISLLPLVTAGETVGMLVLATTDQVIADSSRAQQILNTLSSQASMVVKHARLLVDLAQREKQVQAAYEQLQETDQQKDALLQNLSHELRTPLTHILGYLRLMQDNAFGALNAELGDVINLITHKAQQVADIVENIVMVQQPEISQLRLRPIHLERVVALAVRAIASEAQAKNIRIAPHIPANLPLVLADPTGMEEVFKALLDNAIKFSPLNSQIEITLEDSGDAMLRACVRDHGIGIPAEEQSKIFHRFYQVDSGTTRRFSGTGLGLAIVRQIMDGHHGRVWVESEPGKGSHFYLLLPKAAAMAAYDLAEID